MQNAFTTECLVYFAKGVKVTTKVPSTACVIEEMQEHTENAVGALSLE